MAKKKLDTLMKESKIRDREDPDNFTITSLPAEKRSQKGSPKVLHTLHISLAHNLICVISMESVDLNLVNGVTLDGDTCYICTVCMYFYLLPVPGRPRL